MNRELSEHIQSNARACIKRNAGHEQRSPQQVTADNSFVNLWMATFQQHRNEDRYADPTGTDSNGWPLG